MKKALGLMMSMALAAGIAMNAEAKSEKKNVPKTDDVEIALKAAGADHFPEKMKVDKVGPIKAGDTFYHAYCGTMKKADFRVIFMDNSGSYLGYYTTEYEPSDYEEGAVLLDSGESDSDGNTSYFSLRVGKDGPSEKVNIDGTPVAFVKNPKITETTAAVAATESTATAAESGPIQPEYREWVLINRGKEVTVEAIYVKQTGSKITLKQKSDGRSKDFPLSMLSAADKEYLKTLN